MTLRRDSVTRGTGPSSSIAVRVQAFSIQLADGHSKSGACQRATLNRDRATDGCALKHLFLDKRGKGNGTRRINELRGSARGRFSDNRRASRASRNPGSLRVVMLEEAPVRAARTCRNFPIATNPTIRRICVKVLVSYSFSSKGEYESPICLFRNHGIDGRLYVFRRSSRAHGLRAESYSPNQQRLGWRIHSSPGRPRRRQLTSSDASIATEKT